MTDNQLVVLYTTDSLSDPVPLTFNYYLDWTGAEVTQAVANYLQLNYDPSYIVLVFSTQGSAYLDQATTLRQQNITNGCKLVYLSPETVQQLTQSTMKPAVQEQALQSLAPEIEPPQLYDDEPPNFDENLLAEMGTGLSTVREKRFGGIGQADMDLLNEDNDAEDTTPKVKINVMDGFNEQAKAEIVFKVSYSFDDVLDLALNTVAIQGNGPFAMLLDSGKKNLRWFKDGDYLENYNPIDGMAIHLFNKKMSLKVNFQHQSSRTIVVDITQPVKDVVEEIAHQAQFASYLGFTLWTWPIDKSEPLRANLSLPEQTQSFKSVLFRRKYFIFSREDLMTLDTAIWAFKDASKEFHQCKYAVITEEQAFYYLACCVYAQEASPNINHLTDDILSYLPPTYKSKISLSKLQTYLETFRPVEKLDQFNACRLALKFVRRIHGFAAKQYQDVDIEVKVNKKKSNVQMKVLLSPLSILIINPQNGVLEERISISKIINLNLLSQTLEIKFAIVNSDGNVGKYNFTTPYAEEMKNLIETYRDISKMIIYNRAKISDSGIDIHTINEKNRIYLFTSTDIADKAPKKYAYDSSFSGEQLIKCAEQNLQLTPDKNHVALVRLMKNSYRWIYPDTILSVANVQDGMSVFILKNNQPVRVEHVDGHVKTLLLNITEPIENLVPLVFQKEALPNIIGYTFYSLEDPKNPRPLDTRYSIPEQTAHFKSVLLKRRFYVLSGEVLQNALAALFTVKDCNSYLLSPTSLIKSQDEIDKIIHLGILYLYANATDSSTVKKQTIIYPEFIPPSIKVDKKFEAKFQAELKKSQPLESFLASKQYLGMIRTMPGFGEEKFPLTTYQEYVNDKKNGKQMKDVIMFIGPMKIIFIQEKGKKPLHEIPYRLIISYQSMSHTLKLKIADQNVIKDIEITIKDIDTVLMLVGYNIKIIRDLLLSRQRQKQKELEDIAKRLSGGYIDENGIVRTRMIDFLPSSDLDKRERNVLPLLWLEIDRFGRDVIQEILPIVFSRSRDKETDRRIKETQWVILLWKEGYGYRWVLGDETLASKNPERKTVLFVIEEYPTVKIIFTNGGTKKMKIHIVDIVQDIVPVIAQKLFLKNHFGYTLYVINDGKEPKPLNLQLSIPEQITHYEELEFRRRFFVISKYDYEDDNALYLTFCDVRELVRTGKIDMTYDDALTLLYYEFHVDGPSNCNPNSFPSDKDLPKYLPSYMTKPNISKGKKKFAELFTTSPVKDKTTAMTVYIDYAKKLPTFGTTSFLVTLVQEKRGHQVRTPVYLYVGPNRVFCMDENKKKEIAEAEVFYKRFISLQVIDEELSLKHCPHSTAPEYVEIESKAAETIAELILSHLAVHRKILIQRAIDQLTIPTDRVELFTQFGFHKKDDKNTIHIYDLKDTGDQIIQKGVRYLNKNPRGQYSCLLRRCDDEQVWVRKDTVLGTHFPFSGLTIHIYYTYMPVQVSTENKTRTILLNVERPVSELIDEIAFKMYVDFYLGYTLFYEDQNGRKVPLDLNMSIPEQTSDFQQLYFYRRFIVILPNDMKTQAIHNSLYHSCRNNILSGIPIIMDKDFRNSTTIVSYQLIIETGSVRDAIRACENEDLAKYLPTNFKQPKNFRQMVSENLSKLNQSLKKEIIIQQFINLSKALDNFGADVYQDVTLIYKPKKAKKETRKICAISIAPAGIRLYAPDKDLFRIDYASLRRIHNIKDRILLGIDTNEDAVFILTLLSKEAASIYKLLKQYKDSIVPLKSQREDIYHLKDTDEYIEMLNKADEEKVLIETKGNKVQSQYYLYPERQFDHPNPAPFKFAKNFTTKQLANLALHYLVYPNKNIYERAGAPNEGYYTILSSAQKQVKDADYTWIQPGQTLQDAKVNPKSFLFVVESNPLAQVITSNNFVYEEKYPINSTIYDCCSDLCLKLNVGTHLGFTFYEILNGTQRPLDFLFRIPDVSPNYVEVFLKRRFYLFSMDIFNDPASLDQGYEDVKQMIMNGSTMGAVSDNLTNFIDDQTQDTLNISRQDALTLAIYSLYAEAPDPLSVMLKVNNISDDDMNYLFPKKFKNAKNLIAPLQKLSKEITLDQKNAKIQYIIYANELAGYGAEVYKVLFSDKYDISKDPEPARIILSPYRIIIEVLKDKSKNNKVLNDRVKTYEIYWNLINMYERNKTNNSVFISYNNDDGVLHEIILYPYADQQHRSIKSDDEHSREIYSFINDIINLFRKPEFANFPDFKEMATFEDMTQLNDSTIDFNPNYDDLAAIEARGLNLDFDTFMNHGSNDDYYRNSSNDPDGNNYTWRATNDGLLYRRAGEFLDDLLNDLDYIRKNINDMDPNDLLRMLNFINDEILRFAMELNDEDREIFLKLSKGLDHLRALVQKIAANDLNFNSYIPRIVTYIENYMAGIPPLKKLFEDKLAQLKLKALEDIQLNNPYGLRIPAQDADLAMLLLNLSDIQEQLGRVIHTNYRDISYLLDPANLIKQLQGMSMTLTSFAHDLINQTGDPEMIRKKLPIFLNDVGKISQIISQLSLNLKNKNVTIPEMDRLNEELMRQLKLLLSSPALLNVDNQLKRFFVLYPGNFRPVEELLKDLDEIIKKSAEIMKLSQVKGNKDLEHSLLSRFNNLNLNTETLTNDLKKLQANPNDDLARSEAYAALCEVENILKSLGSSLNPLKNSDQVKQMLGLVDAANPKLTDSLYNISPINVTPTNVQRVVDDINMLLNRYAALSASATERFNEQERENAAKTVIFLKDIISHFDNILPALEKNPTSGEIVYLAQQWIIKVAGKLPDINQFTDALHRITVDHTYPVLYERLITHVRAALLEAVTSEDITKLPHLIAYQQLQADTGNALNITRQFLLHQRVHNNEDLSERLEQCFDKVKDNYLNQVIVRTQIRERPFSDDALNAADEVVAALKNIIDKMQPAGKQVSDITSNLKLEQQLISLLSQIEKTLELLKKARMEPYRRPPTKEDVKNLSSALVNMNQVLLTLLKLTKVVTNHQYLESLNDAYKQFANAINALKVMAENPTEDFYKICEQCQITLNNVTPTLEELPEFTSNEQHVHTHKTLDDLLKKLLEPGYPTFDIVKTKLKELRPADVDFIDYLNQLLKESNISSNPSCTSLFNSWVVDCGETLKMIDECLNAPNFNLTMANNMKLNLLNLLKKISGMPMSVRDAMTQEQKMLFAQKLSELARRAIAVINCIRQLPGNKKIISDPRDFRKIEAEEEFSESVPCLGAQCQKLQKFFNDVSEARLIEDRPHSHAMLQSIIKQFSWINFDDFKPTTPEKTQLETMQKLKESLPFITTSTELISPIIGDPNVVRNIRLFGDNLTLLTRLLSGSHLTEATAEKFKKLATPMINNLLKQLEPFMKQNDVKSVKLLLDSLTAFNNTLAISAREIGPAKPRKTQQICDSLYQTSGLLIPYLQENPNHDKVLDSVNELFELCQQFTSLPLIRIRFSDCLQPKKQLFSDEQYETLSKQVTEALINNDAEIKNELFETLTEDITVVNDNSSSIPPYLSRSALIEIPPLKSHVAPTVCGSARTIFSTCTNSTLLDTLLSRLVVDCSVRCAHSITSIAKSLPFLLQQIEENAEWFDDEAKFAYVKLENSIKQSDPTLLLQCQSLPTAVFNFKAMHSVETSLQLLLNKIVNLEQIKSIVQPLSATANVYSDWIYQYDLVMMTYFLCNMDMIVTNLESILVNDKTRQLPKEIRLWIRQVVSNLRSKDRGASYDQQVISSLAQQFIQFQSDFLPVIKSKIDDCDNLKELLARNTSLDKIKTIIRTWINPLEGLNKESAFLNIVSSLYTTHNSIVNAKSSLSTSLPETGFNVQPIHSKLTSVTYDLNKGIELKMPFKEPQVIALKTNTQATNLADQQTYEQEETAKSLDALLSSVNNCITELRKAVPIDFSTFDELQNFAGSHQAIFNMIDDKNCLDFAKIVAAYLDKIVATMKKMSNNSETIPAGPHKYMNSISIKGANGKDTAIPRTPVKLNSAIEGMSLRALTDDEIKKASANFQSLLDSTYRPSNILRNISLEEYQRLLISQRLLMLLQEQCSEFPEIIKNINLNTQQVITPDQVMFQLRSLQAQYDSMNSQTELRKVQSRYTLEQFKIQQLLLTYAIYEIGNERCYLPTETALQSTTSTRKKFFETILNEIEKSGSPKQTATIDEIREGIIRGYSLVSLINQLIHISQQLNSNTPDIYTFTQSPEGLQLLKVPLTAHQLLEQQQNVHKQINLCYSPEMLNAFQKSLLPDDIIMQQRIIFHLLSLLTNEFGASLPINSKIETSPASLLTAVSSQQQEIIKTSPDVLVLQYYLSSADLINWQTKAFELYNRISFAQTVLDLASVQLYANPNAATLPAPTKPVSTTPTAAKAEHASLVKQYDQLESDSLNALAKALNKKQLEDEQSILGVIAFLALAPPNEGLLFPSNLSNIVLTLLSSLSALQSDQLKITGEPLNIFNPLIDSSNTDGFEIADFASYNLRGTQAVKNLLNHLIMKNPDLRKVTTIPDFSNAQQLEKTKAIISRLIELSSNQQLSTQFIDQQVPKDEVQRVYSLLVLAAANLNSSQIRQSDIHLLNTESRLYDQAALIQRLPIVGLPSATTEEKELFPTAKIEETNKVATTEKSVSSIRLLLTDLMLQRAVHYPDIASKAAAATKLDDLFKSNNVEIESNIQSLVQQLGALGDDKKLGELLSRLSPNSLLVQQVILQSLYKQLDVKETHDAIEQSLTQAIEKTAGDLLQGLPAKFAADEKVFTESHPPLYGELLLNSKKASENNGRISLVLNLLSIQQAIRSMKGIEEFVSSPGFENATNETYPVDEILDIQDSIRNLLITHSTKTEIQDSYEGQKPEVMSRILSLLNNLTVIIAPASLGFTPKNAKPDSFESSANVPSLFHNTFNVALAADSIGATITEIRLPSEKQRASCVANSLNGILNLLPSLIHMPMQECITILIAENQAALAIIQELYKSQSTSYSKKIPDLIEIAAQLSASLSRVYYSLPANIQPMIIKELLDIEISIENMQKYSCLENNAANREAFKTNIAKMLSYCLNIDAALVKGYDILPIRALECYARMAIAISRNDIDTLNYQICLFNSLLIHQDTFNINYSSLKTVNAAVTKISPLVSKAFTTHCKIDSAGLKSLTDFRNQLVDIINKETLNPFTFVAGLTKNDDVLAYLNTVKYILEIVTKELINAVHAHDKELSQTCINTILKTISLAEASMARCFAFAKSAGANVYQDYFSMVNSAINAFHQTVDFSKSNAISSTAIRRSTRNFTRMINSMIDMCEDLKTTSSAPSQSKIEQCRLNFLRAVTDTTQHITSTVSAKTGSLIPETFVLIMKDQIAPIDKNIEALKTTGAAYCEVNTNKAASDDFTAQINKLEEIFAHFKAAASSDVNLVNSPKHITKITNGYFDIIETISRALDYSLHFTDVIPLKPDLDSAEKLKKGYAVPPVPNDTDKLKVKDAFSQFEKVAQVYKTNSAAFFTLANNKDAKNADIVTSMNKLYTDVDNVVLAILRMSTTIMNIDIQSGLTNACYNIAKPYDTLLKELRAKFVLSGEFDKQAPILSQQILNSIDSATNFGKRAVSIADEEEKLKSSILSKFDECLKPLMVATSSLEKSKESRGEAKNITDEYSLRMLEIGIALSSAIKSVMMLSRSHTTKLTKEHDELFAFTKNITNELSLLNTAIEDFDAGKTAGVEDQPEKTVIERMRSLNNLGMEYTKKTKAGNAEEQALHNTIVTICKGASQLAQSAENALNSKKEQLDRKTGVSKDTLLKRLELESNVIKARIILEHNEKVLAGMQ